MKKLSLLWIALVATSCAGMTVTKQPPAEKPKSKPGLTLNGGGIGAVQVQKVGFYCEVKHGFLSFTDFGETEEKATATAKSKCLSTFKDGPCEPKSCKPASAS